MRQLRVTVPSLIRRSACSLPPPPPPPPAAARRCADGRTKGPLHHGFKWLKSAKYYFPRFDFTNNVSADIQHFRFRLLHMIQFKTCQIVVSISMLSQIHENLIFGGILLFGPTVQRRHWSDLGSRCRRYCAIWHFWQVKD